MSNTHQLLQSLKDRIVSRETERREIVQDIKDIYAEAQSAGFSAAALRKVIKKHFETPEQAAKREAVEEMEEIYLANLGMLGGTPLGEAARSRLSKPDNAPAPSMEQDDAPLPEEEKGSTIGADDIAAARQRGADDAKAGKKVLENPFTSGDPRRAAWDEGWCAETGTDGMELPEALRPKKKPKPDEKPDGSEGEER